MEPFSLSWPWQIYGEGVTKFSGNPGPTGLRIASITNAKVVACMQDDDLVKTYSYKQKHVLVSDMSQLEAPASWPTLPV